MTTGKFKSVKNHFVRRKSPYAPGSLNLVWKFLRNREKRLFHRLVQDLSKDICLDFGAGSCEYSKTLLEMGAKKTLCVDFNPSFLKGEAFPGMEKIVVDVENYETGEKCDLILCLGVLEFLEKPERFLIRIRRFLKPSGRVIVLLPLSGGWSFCYRLVYLLQGIVIQPLTLKNTTDFLLNNGFLLEKTAGSRFFSGFAVFSLTSIEKPAESV